MQIEWKFYWIFGRALSVEELYQCGRSIVVGKGLFMCFSSSYRSLVVTEVAPKVFVCLTIH